MSGFMEDFLSKVVAVVEFTNEEGEPTGEPVEVSMGDIKKLMDLDRATNGEMPLPFVKILDTGVGTALEGGVVNVITVKPTEDA